MNTEQSYVGRGDSSPNSSPAANSGHQTPLAAAERQAKYQKLIAAKQKQLLNLVDSFYASDMEANPVEIINDLLLRWLTTPAVDLANEVNQTQLRVVLDLVSFLSNLKNSLTELGTFEAIAEREEVSRG